MARLVEPLKALSPAALVAGSGAVPRRLAHPVVLSLDVAANPSDPLADVTVTWAAHPAIEAWIKQHGSVSVNVKDIAGSAFAESTQRRRGKKPMITAANGRLRVVGPRLPEPGPAAAVLSELRQWQRIPVIGTPAWFEHAKVLQNAVVAIAANDPTRVCAGPPLGLHETTPVEAMRMLEAVHLTRRIAADTVSVDLAALSLAAGEDRPGLMPGQDLAASQLLASDIGVVLAHPPGSGKTVVVAAALQEVPTGTTVVLAPPSVLKQWVAELHTWAPGRRAILATRSSELPCSLAPGDVLVSSHNIGASWLVDCSVVVSELVLDEGHVVLGASDLARRLWQARTKVDRAWLLTGTPGERYAQADAAVLAAWSRGCPPGRVLPRSVNELAPVVLLPHVAAGVPDVATEIVELPATSADTAWLAVLRERFGQPVSAFERARAGALIRRGLAAPTALGEDGAWSKTAYASERAVAHAAAGGSVLVFADTLSVLSQTVDMVAEHGVPGGVLTPSLSRSERARLLAAFSSGDLPVLAVSPASQRGVNLQKSDLAIHLDMPATLSMFEQRNGRAARLGSQHPLVHAVIPVIGNSWEHQWVSAFLSGETDPLSVMV